MQSSSGWTKLPDKIKGPTRLRADDVEHADELVHLHLDLDIFRMRSSVRIMENVFVGVIVDHDAEDGLGRGDSAIQRPSCTFCTRVC